MSFRNSIVPIEVPRASNRQKYHEGIALQILNMAEAGQFPEEWCAEIGITMRTLYGWANKHPEFEEAVEAAWHVLHAYWARFLRENITNPGLRQTAILKVMAKRFPATWGNELKNTLDHFQTRNDPPEQSLHGIAKQQPALTREERRKRIDTLIERYQSSKS